MKEYLCLTFFNSVSPPSPQGFSLEAVREGLTFFQRFPRFTADERKKFLLELAENPNPPLADVCVELPSNKRELCHKVNHETKFP
jgi:hypothetical protein